MNNFKELEKMQVEKVDFGSKRIKSGISSSINAFSFVGNMLDLFLPKVLGIFVNMTGGDDSKTTIRRPKYPNTQG